jgi:hypothetical protein
MRAHESLEKEQGRCGAINCALSQGRTQLSTCSYSLSAASPVKAFLRLFLLAPFRPPQRRTPKHFWKRANRILLHFPKLCALRHGDACQSLLLGLLSSLMAASASDE